MYVWRHLNQKLHQTSLSLSGDNVTASPWCMWSQLTNPSLFCVGSVLKAHLTFSSPCWGAGNKTEECTCLLGWPTSLLLLNYSRALKCSSVWPHATRVPVCPSWQQPHRASIYAWEGSSVCVYSVGVRVCLLPNTNAHTFGVIYTDNIPKKKKKSHLDLIHKVLNYKQRKDSFWGENTQTLQKHRRDVTPLIWCFDAIRWLICVKNFTAMDPAHMSRQESNPPTEARHNL